MMDSVLIIIVIYNVRLAESAAFRSLTEVLLKENRAGLLFIYDNSLQSQKIPVCPCWTILYCHDPNNPGVSKAYNQAFIEAKKLGIKWMLLVDQDTTFPLNAFEQYQKSIDEFNIPIVVPTLSDRFGPVSPLKFFYGGGNRQKKLKGGSKLALNDFYFHNSGLLISTVCFEMAGLYDELLPLDFSDFSFVERLRKKNIFFGLANFVCGHDLATTSSASTEKLLSRFESYVRATRYFKKNYRANTLMLGLRVFLRAVRFSVLRHNFRFIALYLK